MKYLLNAEYSVTAVNYSGWVGEKKTQSYTIMVKTGGNTEGVILMLIWIWGAKVVPPPLTRSPPELYKHTHADKHHINILSALLMLLSRGSTSHSFWHSLQHCQNIWININTMIYSRMLHPQLSTQQTPPFFCRVDGWVGNGPRGFSQL